MLTEIIRIIEFVLQQLWHIAPYLLISIPIAVAIRVTDASQFIRRALSGHPVVAVLLATVVGAFSPFCSCSVIPVVASLLIAGVPLAPVMAFWIASPSMDPEIFVLSVGLLGWELALVRLVSTLILSLSAGLITLQLTERGFFRDGILKEQRGSTNWSWRNVGQTILDKAQAMILPARPEPVPVASAPAPAAFIALDSISFSPAFGGSGAAIPVNTSPASQPAESACACNAETKSCACEDEAAPQSRWQKIGREMVSVTVMLVKFMILAYVLEAMILFYVPQEAIVASLGSDNPLAVMVAALLGIPIYTSNLAALPLIDGLLEQGMAPGAALAYLIAGPTTTLPAMAAVYGITKRRVFIVYLSIAMIGAILLGYLYALV